MDLSSLIAINQIQPPLNPAGNCGAMGQILRIPHCGKYFAQLNIKEI